ncbi:ABC transporter ATP-binding protein/permease [Acidobacteria bacterium AH-259-D05]|nr:ABC transporter ATP-binding protein/permease [Acidobacteria bacterium AH-259-D05]
MKVFTFIRDLFRKFPFLIAGNTLLMVVESLIGIAAIVTIAPIIDFFLNPDLENASAITDRGAAMIESIGLPVTLGSFLAVFLVSRLLKNGFSIFARYCLLRTKTVVLRDLVIGTSEDLFRARWLFFSSSKQGTILNTFLHEIPVVAASFGTMGVAFAHFLQLVSYVAVSFYLSWQVTSLSLAIAVLFASPFLLLGKVNYRLGKLNTSTSNEVSTVILENLSLAKVILGFGNQDKRIRDLGRTYDAHRRVAHKSLTLQAAMPQMYEPLGLLVLIIALFTAQKFAIPLSEMAVLLWALRASIPLVGDLVANRNLLENFVPSYEQVKSLKQRARELEQRSGELPFTGFHTEIAFENVTFAYPGHEPTLADINLRVPKGRMVAIVGESGAGKSTLIDMIMGFNEPMAGQITFDGVPLQRFDINSYRRQIGYVPQDSILFNMTIRDNLRWANEAATDAEINEACWQANADKFIEEFPEGYNTLVGDLGVRLSGGQIQRITLARAILRKPELLILDEATSSLDTHSERLIQRAIEAIAKKTTVIVIAHRLSTIVNAGYVYVLEKGRVVEEGTYSELVEMNGQFNRMVRLQVLLEEAI